MLLHILSSAMHRERLSMPFEVSEEFLQNHQVVAVLTGGTEGKFVQLVKEGLIDLKKPVYLVVSGHSNSLAASLEILSYIRQHNGTGRVLDKEPSDEVPSTKEGVTIEPSESVLKSAQPLRLGVVGFPSDWLVSSLVDYKQVLERMNCELVDIPIEEVTSLGEVDPGMKGAEAIYGRLKEIVSRYDLQGVTLRCFDLLTTVKNTGCIALSKLNDEGIPAACEGDIPTLLTMMVCKRLTGELCFQVNPARIHADGEMLFAHCTLPLGMTEKHEYTTHFESGIGVAIHGELPTGDYTLVKLSGDLKRMLAADVELERCQYEENLCRTQVWIKATPELARYFLTDPIHNHHVLIKGHHASKFKVQN
jgi:L-fucose isomerase-like protein